MALKSEAVTRHLDGKPPRKIIYVPDQTRSASSPEFFSMTLAARLRCRRCARWDSTAASLAIAIQPPSTAVEGRAGAMRCSPRQPRQFSQGATRDGRERHPEIRPPSQSRSPDA